MTSYGRGLDSTALTPLPAQDRMYPFGIIEIAAWLQGERVQSRDLAQFQQDKGRLETEAAGRESDRTEAEEVHADVVAAGCRNAQDPRPGTAAAAPPLKHNNNK